MRYGERKTVLRDATRRDIPRVTISGRAIWEYRQAGDVYVYVGPHGRPTLTELEALSVLQRIQAGV